MCSWPRTRVLDVKTTFVVDRSFSKAFVVISVPLAPNFHCGNFAHFEAFTGRLGVVKCRSNLVPRVLPLLRFRERTLETRLVSFSKTLMINEEKTKEIITEEVWICDLNYHKIAPEISDKMHHKTLKHPLPQLLVHIINENIQRKNATYLPGQSPAPKINGKNTTLT